MLVSANPDEKGKKEDALVAIMSLLCKEGMNRYVEQVQIGCCATPPPSPSPRNSPGAALLSCSILLFISMQMISESVHYF